MCGICGQMNLASKLPIDPRIISRMTESMRHRGPDDEGYYVTNGLGLGFRRLSIIDIDGGHQPMSDPAGKIWVVFNGEIYNFRELRTELEALGHQFRTRSDTEVIIHGYEEWGKDVLCHLNGMFGLAIWDEIARRLIVARDRMGIKLVYYRLSSAKLVFGSEIRSILANDDGKCDVDPVALYLFLRYRYSPSEFTIRQGIKKLAAGTRLIVEKGNVSVERWWNYKPVSFDRTMRIEEAEDNLLDLYKQAVRRHLISDVPLGLLLSGGIDSGLLLGLMNGFGSSWETFSVGYGKEYKQDELDDAAHTAEYFGARHYDITLSRKEFDSTLPGIISCLEEPIASSSIVPMYHVCRLARGRVKVALSGQGPDELFGGYPRHLGVRYAYAWRALPQWIREPAKSAMKVLPRADSLKRSLYSLDVKGRLERYQQVFSIAPHSEISALFHDGIVPSDAGEKIMESWRSLEDLMAATDELGGLQFLELRYSLPDELLMYSDKLSMAHGLELRVPYLDQEIVEFAESLPADFKIHLGSMKWIHRRICRKYLPRRTIRAKKRGFAVNVVDDWLRDSLEGRMQSIFSDADSLMYRYIKQTGVQELLKDHIEGRRDRHKLLFSLVVFEEWLRGQQN